MAKRSQHKAATPLHELPQSRLERYQLVRSKLTDPVALACLDSLVRLRNEKNTAHQQAKREAKLYHVHHARGPGCVGPRPSDAKLTLAQVLSLTGLRHRTLQVYLSQGGGSFSRVVYIKSSCWVVTVTRLAKKKKGLLFSRDRL